MRPALQEPTPNKADALPLPTNEIHRFGRAALPKKLADTDDPVALGREAWLRRKADARACWADWLMIGEALVIGRREAMAKANKSKPAGKKYNQLFHYWIQTNGFEGIDKSDRHKLLYLMENLDKVKAWRGGLSEDKCTQLNHPSAVYRAFVCKRRGNRGNPPVGEPKEVQDIAAPTLATIADEFEEEQAEIAWQRGLLLRARKAIGDADLKGLWVLSEPPDAGLISVVRTAADGWQDLARYLESIRNATPEELEEARKSYAKAQQSLVEAKARKEEHRLQQTERVGSA